MSRQLASAIDIDARPAQVRQVLTDLGAYAEWNPFIVHAEGRAQAGSRLTLRMQPAGSRNERRRCGADPAGGTGEDLRMHVTVVGAGIIGLTVALHARRAGHSVQVVAAAPPPETTSSVAAALWYPYRAYPRDAVARWAAAGFTALSGLAGDPRTGVRLRTGRELFGGPAPDPWWRDAVPSVHRVPAAGLPAGYADGFELTVPVVDMAVHLAWLAGHLQELGVACTRRRVEDLGGLDADVVVNCAGLGARELCDDATVLPVRGQVVLVEQVGLERWTLDQSDPELLTYVVPRLDTIVLGGTAEEGDEDLAVRPPTAAQVLARCTAVVPELAGARVVAHRVGLRPGRPAVRLETEQRAGGPVVHCYGHGGAGVTLAHGCAQDVVGLLARLG